MVDNPYEPDNSFPAIADGRMQTLVSLKVVGFVVLVGAIGGLLGLCLGYGVAALAPEYYNQLFNSAGDPAFSPERMGIALGVSQGFGAGIAVGVILAIADFWIRSGRNKNSTAAD